MTAEYSRACTGAALADRLLSLLELTSLPSPLIGPDAHLGAQVGRVRTGHGHSGSRPLPWCPSLACGPLPLHMPVGPPSLCHPHLPGHTHTHTHSLVLPLLIPGDGRSQQPRPTGPGNPVRTWAADGHPCPSGRGFRGVGGDVSVARCGRAVVAQQPRLCHRRHSGALRVARVHMGTGAP